MSKGFNNIGNTCYLNSGLQMLVQNKDFCKKVFINRNTSDNLRKMTDFIIEYYNTENNKSLSPNQIKGIVERIRPMFRGNRQHDSEEFIISLIEVLNDVSDVIFPPRWRPSRRPVRSLKPAAGPGYLPRCRFVCH
jgi:ubiquitin C-terminal hydrolase